VWEDGDVEIEIRALNDATLTSRVVSRVTRWLRRPVVLFGSIPLQAVVPRADTWIEGSTPPQILPGAVDVVVYGGAGATGTTVDGFEYLLSPGVQVFGQSGARVTTLRDLVIRGQV
jgi:hypothetical protein